MAHAPIIEQILTSVREEIVASRSRCSESELKRMVADAPPVRSFRGALAPPFGLIAEIKARSPSMGDMRGQNVTDAPAAYEASDWVRALSVLTNTSHFGMSMQRLADIRARVTKPVLRKDFMLEPYQVWEARAYGADAILLMSQVLDADQIRELQDLAGELGMDALVECHTREQIERAPAGTAIYGINSRSFHLKDEQYAASRAARDSGSSTDLTIDLGQFDYIHHLPADAIKVAESGIRPETVAGVRDAGFHAALIGTGLLVDPDGIVSALAKFEVALGGEF